MIDPHLEKVASEAANECWRAMSKFPMFNSGHEGLAVIWEEFEELKQHVWENRSTHPAARFEAIQIAAMALRYVFDLCDND